MQDTARPMIAFALVISWLALTAGSLAVCRAAARGDERGERP